MPCCFIGHIRPSVEFERLVPTSTLNLLCTRYRRAPPQILFKNVENTPPERMKEFKIKQGSIDLLCAGFPCQPFSKLGLLEGTSDAPRGGIIYYVLDIIHGTSPRVVLLENVASLLTTFKPLLNFIVNVLNGMGYIVKVWKLNSCDSMIPHSRARAWIVAIRADSYFHELGEPKKIAFKPRLQDGFVDVSANPKLLGASSVLNETGKKAVAKAVSKLREAGVKFKGPNAKTVIVDAESSIDFSSHMVECSPCITASRGASGGHYVLQRGSRMTVTEIGALMGVSAHKIKAMQATGHSDKVIGHALGNAQSVNVLERILGRALWCAGLLKNKFVDPWEVAAAKASKLASPPADTLEFVSRVRGSLRD